MEKVIDGIQYIQDETNGSGYVDEHLVDGIISIHKEESDEPTVAVVDQVIAE